MLVAKREPTPCYRDAYSVGSSKWTYRRKGWQIHCETTFSPLYVRLFLVSKRTSFFFFGRWWFGCSTSGGRARHLVLVLGFFTPGQLPVEFVNVGGCLIYGDLAMDSCAQFLTVAEHRLIPSRARSVGHFLRKAGHHSILGSCLSA